MKFKPKQKVWFITLSRESTWDVQQGQVTKVENDGTVMVRYEFDYEGKPQTTVTDMRPDKVFPTEKEALVFAAELCMKTAQRHTQRGYELLQLALKAS